MSTYARAEQHPEMELPGAQEQVGQPRIRQIPGYQSGYGLDARDLIGRYRRIIIGGDFLAGIAAGVIGLLVRFGVSAEPIYWVITAAVPFLWVGALAALRGYEDRFLGTGPDEFRRLGDATLALFAVFAVISYLTKGDLSRGYVMIVLPTAMVLSYFARRLLRRWLFTMRLNGQGLQKVLVVGRSDAVEHLIEQFEREPWHGFVPVATCVPEMVVDLAGGTPTWRVQLPFTGDPDAIVQAVDELGVNVVAVASDPDLSGQTLRRLAWALEERSVELLVSPGIVEVRGPRLSIRPVAGLSLLHLERPAVKGGRMVIKTSLDRISACSMLLLGSPVLLVLAGLVKFTSPGPVIFKQTRIGVDGAPFQMWKFRSMVADAEKRRSELETDNEGAGPLFKMKNDPRVTRVGAVLRRFSLDELPQLVNVAKGEMSLVGPRPPLPAEVAQYDSDATRRLRVRPGLTGLWQVSGRSDLSWEESLRLDLRYVDNWSFWLDLTILWRTARAVLQKRGAY